MTAATITLAATFLLVMARVVSLSRELASRARTDSLTGLAHRARFQEELGAAVVAHQGVDAALGILLVDLDDFKVVNESFGHTAGDELLRVVASRLAAVVRPGDLVARLGGDEFAILLDGVADRTAALAVAQRAVASLAMPVDAAGTRMQVGASVGLTTCRAGSDAESLMREADVAMCAGKQRGKNRVERYDAALHDATMAFHAVRAELAGAAGRGELVLDYQPVVDLVTGDMSGVEALVRWQHPVRGLLPPSAFIEQAEESGAISSIGEWVLRTSTRQVHDWQLEHPHSRLWLSVNVSVRQLEAGGFPDLVAATLLETGLEPRQLVLEVTESVLARPAGGAGPALEDLRRLGVRIALDDFGTGFSSINYLRQLPVDVLKIDRSFLSQSSGQPPGDGLLAALVGLGRQLGLEVIPEGIETNGHLKRLQDLGCRLGQGFLMSRPVPAATIAGFLSAALPIAAVAPFAIPEQRADALGQVRLP